MLELLALSEISGCSLLAHPLTFRELGLSVLFGDGSRRSPAFLPHQNHCCRSFYGGGILRFLVEEISPERVVRVALTALDRQNSYTILINKKTVSENEWIIDICNFDR